MRRAAATLASLALLGGACNGASPAKDAGVPVPATTSSAVPASPTDGASPLPGATASDTPAFAPTPTAPVRGDSRDLPLGIGRGRPVGEEWDVTVVGYDADATDEVLAFNPGNTEPPPGEVFALARVQATYIGPNESANAFLNLEWALVDDAGELHTDADCGVLPDDLASQGGVPNGSTAEGTICFSVPEGMLDRVVLHIAPLLGDPSTRIWWSAPKEGAGRVLEG